MNARLLFLAAGLTLLGAGVATAEDTTSTAPTPLFHGTSHDCDADNFGGHLPQGFSCRGTGTGVGICANARDKRLISYDVQADYCHLEWLNVSQAQLENTLRFLKCQGANPECATAAFSNKRK
jgi:hypothetical protein